LDDSQMSASSAVRVVDYFVLLSITRDKVEQSGRFKQIGLPLSAQWRFPLSDLKDCEFPSDLGTFAFPDGASLRPQTAPNEEYSFVLTEGDGGRIYCQALRYWQAVSSVDKQTYERLNYCERTAQEQTLFAPYILVIVSHWPFLRQFELTLKRVYAVLMAGNDGARPSYPIENFLENLVYEIPLPPRGRRIVEFDCYGQKIHFSRPAPNQLPLRGTTAQMNTLLHTLSLNNILTVFTAMLCEKRILLYTSHVSLLTPCIEALCTLLFPFYWQHIYVPVLPCKFTDFIYAPMPFICGVLPSYLPDLSLLEGVVFVDLDENVVKYHASDPVPKFQRLSSSKDINKLVPNPKRLLPASHHIDAREVRSAFVKFFAKFLKSYKICMMPSVGPSKDKFDKQKWLNDYVLPDKDTDRDTDGRFLDLFLEAQLFQCFIDERFDASLNIGNYEVLYFDEKIDETIHNKRTPFLLDSTFQHKPNETYVVPTPPSAATNANAKASAAAGLPLSLDETRFRGALSAPMLVDEDDLHNNQQPTMHISWMSVEFFKQKKLYDRHWHSLEASLNSQNLLFRRILQFFMKWQETQHRYLSDLHVVRSSLHAHNEQPEEKGAGAGGDDEKIDALGAKSTTTSLHKPWLEFERYMQNYCDTYQRAFDESKTSSFIPIMESVASKENELSVMIQTARETESATAKTKCELEFANKNLLKHSKKLHDKQLQLRSTRLKESTGQQQQQQQHRYVVEDGDDSHKGNKKKLDLFVSAVEQKDKYSIEQVECTTAFLTNLEIFSTSMPTMIDEVKTISIDRLANFKRYLLDFVASNRKMHEQFAEQLRGVEQLMQQIDPETDIEPLGCDVKSKPGQRNSMKLVNHSSNPNKPNGSNNNNKSGNKNRPHSHNRNHSQQSMRASAAIAVSAEESRSLSSHISSIGNVPNQGKGRPGLHQQLVAQFEKLSARTSIISLSELKKRRQKQKKAKKGKQALNKGKQQQEEEEEAAAVPDEDELFRITTDESGIDRVSDTLYSDNLWGLSSFSVVLRQNETGKNVIKGLIKACEDLCDIWELQSKSLHRCHSSMRLDTPAISDVETQCWRELHGLTETASLCYKQSVLDLRETVFELKIMKGELKSINKLLQKKKGELSSEVQFATRNVQLAQDECNACKRIYRQTQSQWKTLSASSTNEDELTTLLQQMAAAQLNFKQAHVKWERSKNILRSVKQKEDLCIGVILDTFREKEIARQSIIVHTVSHLVSILFEILFAIHTSGNKLIAACLNVDVEAQLEAFIDDAVTATGAMLDLDSIRWTSKSVEVAWTANKNAIEAVKALLEFFAMRVSATEQYMRNFNRRQDWNIVPDKNTNKFGYSLNDLFSFFDRFVHELCNTSLDALFAVRRNIEPLLHELKRCLEKQNAASHQLIAECNADFAKLEEKLAKSWIECRRLEDDINKLKQRILEKNGGTVSKHPHKGSDLTRKRFKIFERSKEQYQAEMATTQTKLKNEISNRDRLKSQLQQKTKYRDVLYGKVITDFVRHDEYRLRMTKFVYALYVKINEEALLKLHALTLELKKNVSTINIRNNIQKFVLQSRSRENVPKIVLDHAIFKMSQEKNGETEDLCKNSEQLVIKMLAPYQSTTQTMNESLIFDERGTNHAVLLENSHTPTISLNGSTEHAKQNGAATQSKTKARQNVELTFTKHIGNEARITLPKLKEISQNQEISKHLLKYVAANSMKGGKHARIDSLHSISGSAHSRVSGNNSNSNSNNNSNAKPLINTVSMTHSFDENKEDDDDVDNATKGSNVQRIQQKMFGANAVKKKTN